jgi:predicted dinucleotide-binding enzyme
MKIGIIGCGNIGGTLARLWVGAGHEVILSSRHPEQLIPLARTLGDKASVGTPEEASRLGDVILLSIPLGLIPGLSETVKSSLRGKIVMDTCNPYPERDGKFGEEALHDAAGSGVWVAKHLPGAIVVKAFNSVYYRQLQSEAHRSSTPLGIPLASNDNAAMSTVSKLVLDAGFGPLIVGKLDRAKDFDNGTTPYASGATVDELEAMLELSSESG